MFFPVVQAVDSIEENCWQGMNARDRMATRDPDVMEEMNQIRAATTSPRVVSAVAELLAWYEELPLRRVRCLLVNLSLALNDQRDYPPIVEIIDLYDRFLEMTRDQEEKVIYT